MRFPRRRGTMRFKRGTEPAMLVGIRARWIFSYSFERSSAIVASSGSITGMSSRTGYTRRQDPHFRPDPSRSSSTRVLQTGQTRMSRAYFGIKIVVSARIETDSKARIGTVPKAVIRGQLTGPQNPKGSRNCIHHCSLLDQSEQPPRRNSSMLPIWGFPMKNSFAKSKLENFMPAPAISIRMSLSLRKMTLARYIFLFLLAVSWPLAAAFAQSQSSQQSQSPQQSQSQTQSQPPQKEEAAGDATKKAQKEKPKPKKVYTDEDLSGMRGGVSVVGDSAHSNAGPAGIKGTNGKAGANVVPMSGQDEAYWRGKAQPILAEIAAIDQEIAKTKEDIKKYGGDGFDVNSGLKDNIIYIDNRNARVQQLEKRKTDLEKQLDTLQEEGRKAGAAPSWFR
jgi:hypothetical protein